MLIAYVLFYNLLLFIITIYLFSKYLLRTYCMPSTASGSGIKQGTGWARPLFRQSYFIAKRQIR